jgi:hypothetical protein
MIGLVSLYLGWPNFSINMGQWLFQGELFEVLEDDKCLPEEQVQAIAKQLVWT